MHANNERNVHLRLAETSRQCWFWARFSRCARSHGRTLRSLLHVRERDSTVLTSSGTPATSLRSPCARFALVLWCRVPSGRPRPVARGCNSTPDRARLAARFYIPCGGWTVCNRMRSSSVGSLVHGINCRHFNIGLPDFGCIFIWRVVRIVFACKQNLLITYHTCLCMTYYLRTKLSPLRVSNTLRCWMLGKMISKGSGQFQWRHFRFSTCSL